MKHYGIIGHPLGHSLSKQYFTQRIQEQHLHADYNVFDIPSINNALPLIHTLDGFNVTSPHKEAIIPLLTHLDPIAAQIGAVNVVSHGCGFNTDWAAFADDLKPLLTASHTQALVLGTGGAAKAICYALHTLGITPHTVSRTQRGHYTYSQLTPHILLEHLLIVNCTPLGMAPLQDASPDIPYNALTPQHLLYDCIYNPAQTRFLQQAQRYGAQYHNGLGMFNLQAQRAWHIWCHNQ